jgi:hypothetical protein
LSTLENGLGYLILNCCVLDVFEDGRPFTVARLQPRGKPTPVEAELELHSG